MKHAKIGQILCVFLLSLSACSTWFDDPYVEKGVVGGVTGGAVGAGTGALVGAAIANGDIAASALLGGAIGIPAGVLIGVAIQAYNEESEIESNNKIIRDNYNYIVTRQARIERLREEVENDYKSIKLDKNLRRDIYTGPTIGAYNR